MYDQVRGAKPKYKLEAVAEKQKKVMKMGGTTEASAAGTTHSFTEDESLAFIDWINFQLSGDPDLKGHLPIAEDQDDLFKKLHDGIVLW